LPMHSTTGPANHSGGEHRRKCLPTNYTQAHDTVLRRQVESAQYTSIRFTERLAEADIQPSVGAVGSSYDNALAETINGLYKTELIKPRKPWRTIEEVELATAEWVDWFNHRRLHEYCGDIPPVDLETAYYAQHQRPAAG
jgi:putative transposase